MATTMTAPAPDITDARTTLEPIAARYASAADWFTDCTPEEECEARAALDAAVHDTAETLRRRGHRVRARIGVPAPGVDELWELCVDGLPVWRFSIPTPEY